MAKLTLSDLTGGAGVATVINDNNTLIEAAFEETVFRDGTVPNVMNADFDMNSSDVNNVGVLRTTQLFINGQEASIRPDAGLALTDLTDVSTAGVTDGQTLVYDSGTTAWGAGDAATGGTWETVQNGNGATYVDFTIPAGVNLITLGIQSIRGNGFSKPMIQLGNAAGIIVSGYNSTGLRVINGVSQATSSSSGWEMNNGASTAVSFSGLVHIMRVGQLFTSCKWVVSGSLMDISLPVGGCTAFVSGDVQSTTEIETVRVLANGTFNTSNHINIFYQ